MSLASLVKDLRQRTGAGMMDCKKALEASDNDIDKAIEWLRENGIAKAAKKGDRVAAEGLTKTIISGNKAVILELNAETDFVAKNKEFLALLEKVASGLLNSGATTLEAGLAVDIDGETIEQLITAGTATIGEKLTLRRFTILEKTDAEAFVEYQHMGGKISVLVKFAKENQELGKNIAMHIAAEKPLYLNKEAVSAEVLQKEEELIYKESVIETLKKEAANAIKKEEEQAGKALYTKEEFAIKMEEAAQGTLPESLEKRITGIVKGRVNKFLTQSCLLSQGYVMDDKKTVEEIIKEANNEIEQFIRYEVGEGIVKEEVNFADEVAAQANI
ncbi:MAG: translation elongation factor Ts [Mycoplasmatales bacterium]